jgi:hypothetical protein
MTPSLQFGLSGTGGARGQGRRSEENACRVDRHDTVPLLQRLLSEPRPGGGNARLNKGKSGLGSKATVN